MKVRNLQDAVHAVSVEIGVTDPIGEETREILKIRYRALTPNRLQELQAAGDGEGKIGLVEQLAALLIDADLQDDADNPVAPTREILESLPLTVLQSIAGGIIGHITPNSTSGLH